MRKTTVFVLFGLLGCAKATAPTAVIEPGGAVGEEPSFEVEAIVPLEAAVVKPRLPALYRMDGKTHEGACFAEVKKPVAWQTENTRVIREIRRYSKEIDRAVVGWLRDEVFESNAVGMGLDSQEMTYVSPVILNVPLDKLAFDDEQQCVSIGGAFPAETAVVATLIGAKAIELESARPLPRQKLVEMKQIAAKHGIRLTMSNAYTPAVDGDGKPVKNEKKQRLFNSPKGELILKKDIPPKKEQQVVSWKLTFERPIYFAMGTLPSTVWRRTVVPSACEVFLVFDDRTPQVPSCPDFDRAGFGVTRSKTEGHVTLKIATASQTVHHDAPLGVSTEVVVDGQMLLRLVPSSVEEGARLTIEGLWLDNGTPSPSFDGFPQTTESRGKSKKRAAPGGSQKTKKSSTLPPPVGY